MDIDQGFRTKEFERFKNGERHARDAAEWPVAMQGARVVWLSHDTVKSHPRFKDFNAEDWQRVQHILDAGQSIRDGGDLLYWQTEGDKHWMLVIKKTEHGEIYLKTYRRANNGQVRKWKAKMTAPGGA